MKTSKYLTASKTYDTIEEYHDSPELAEIFAPYAENTEIKDAGKWTEFIKAYVVPLDKPRAGRSFELYRLSRVKSTGMLTFKKVTAGACISSAPMRIVRLEENEIELTGYVIKKCDEGRQYAVDNMLIVM